MNIINASLPVSAGWKPIPGYRCRHCCSEARRHPQWTFIWGCLDCGRKSVMRIGRHFIATENRRED
jgi:hypothetical protein